MWLTDWYREWRADRIRHANLANWRRGYDYAIGVFRNSNAGSDKDIIHLQNLVDTARVFNDYSEFDKGIEQALREVQ